MDVQKRYGYFVEIQHLGGLCCPQCKTPVEQSKVHGWDRVPYTIAVSAAGSTMRLLKCAARHVPLL